MYKVGDIVIRTGNNFRGYIGIIKETPSNYTTTYAVEVLELPTGGEIHRDNKIHRWGPSYFKLYKAPKPDWEI